jgi:membrane-bound ClpP family serine protease
VAGGYAFDRVITISGELEKGDADKFRTAISGFDHLLVELNGPGGLLEEGLIIGREIRARHFATGVEPPREKETDGARDH